MKWNERLKKVAHDHGYTQKMLAEQMHVGQYVVAYWYTGYRPPTDAQKQELAMLFGMSITDIWPTWEAFDAHDRDGGERPRTREETMNASGIYLGQRLLRVISEWRGGVRRCIVTVVQMTPDYVRVQYEAGYCECYSYQAIAHDKDLRLLKTPAQKVRM